MSLVTHPVDDLTKLPLRSAFIEAASSELANAREAGRPLSLLVIDVDNFKLVNDTYGHLQGDSVLIEVAELLRRSLRTTDVPARYAGDEFVVLLPGTPGDDAVDVANRICASIRLHQFPMRDRPGSIPVTLSIGVSTFPDNGEETEALFSAADRALYQVKRHGRDGAASATSTADDHAVPPLGIDRFVGRTKELRSLIHLLEKAAEGHPQIVAIAGEAGVGKTTLLRQLEPEVRLRAGSLVVGRCFEADVQPPYAPWVEAITALQRLDLANKRQWRELSRIVPALAPAGTAEEPRSGSKYVLLEEMAEFIRNVARDRPIVIVLDDMQWADSASWDALEYILPQLDDERVLFCLTVRVEETQGEVLERRRRLSRDDRFHDVPLSRLTREELRQWIEAAFHQQEVGKEFLSFLYRHTEGNAFYVVQVLRTLVDEGAIWHNGRVWEYRPVSELRLPTGVGDLISRRISRLSAQTLGILTTAAVIGREFDIDLAIDAGAGDEDELLDAVDEGIRGTVLRATSERGGDRYSFTHVLLAEVLRESVNPRRLRKIHERVADALVKRSPGAAAEIATHYDRGGKADKAYEYALIAADAARAVYAHQVASEFLRMAERNADSPAALAEVRVRLAQIAEATGQYRVAEELCDLAIEWYAGHGEPARAMPLRRLREKLRSLLGQPAHETLRATTALAEEAKTMGLMTERVQLLPMISQAHDRLGDPASAERAAREAVTLAEEIGDPTLLANALTRLGLVLGASNRGEAMEIHRRALALFEQIGDYRGQANTHNNLGIALIMNGEGRAAEAELQRAVDLGRRAGLPDLSGLYALNLGVIYLKGGQYDQARELLGESLAVFAGLKNSERQLYALYNLAHLDRERGESASAADLYDVTIDLARRIGQADVELGAAAGGGLARLGMGEIDQARAAFAQIEPRLTARPDWFQGRELVEALAIQLEATNGHATEAVSRFVHARDSAERVDFYGAAWLTAECAEPLLGHAPDVVRESVNRYAERVKELGYYKMHQRFQDILAQR